MEKKVTLKFTLAELDLLDWFLNRNQLSNRSVALREALLRSAQRDGVSKSFLEQVKDERSQHRERVRLPRGTRSTRRRVFGEKDG